MKNINLISWLRNWFYMKDEHIEYSLGASENSPNLNDTITISVMVKKGDYLAQGHHFELVINDNTVIPLTTNENGIASYSYTCTESGVCKFTAGNSNLFINVRYKTNWEEVTFKTGYSAYNSVTSVYVRRIGDVVEIQGIAKVTENHSATTTKTPFATIPAKYCPSKDVNVMQLGKMKNVYNLTILPNGEVCWSRYGTTSSVDVNANSYLYVHATWTIE